MKFLTLFLIILTAIPNSTANPPAQSRDSWRSVRTNNLLVIGNADAEKLRQVALWLEFFHGAFARLVSRNVIDASVPTTVVVFRDDASFVPFKPLYQGRPANLAGFFQPADDVNYIALSLDPREKDPYSTAFHEYVHLHMKDNVPGAPVWLNEGLAELYGSIQFSRGEVLLGAPLTYYLSLLREHELLPLSTLFSVTTSSPHYNEQDKSGIFYGQSWALVHYLMLGGGPGRQEQFRRFLQNVSRGDDPTKALENSFGTGLAVLEQELEAYVRRGSFSFLRIAGDDPSSTSFTAMQRVSLSDAEANYYLGDLLLHIGRDTDAERHLKQAIALDPSLIPAYVTLGHLTVRQQRWAEARKYLQRAATTPQHYLVHYHYALTLSKEGMSATGEVREYSRENAAIMRDQLLRAIKLAPNFAWAYYLLAFVDLVTREHLDEALEMVQVARRLDPSRSSYALLLAEIHAERSELAAARTLLEPLTRDSNPAIRKEAETLLDWLNNPSPSNRAADNSRSSTTLIAEPVEAGAVRMLGGDSGGGAAIRDGHTIQSSDLTPTVDELLAKYVEALGGAAAVNAVTSRVTKGTLDIARLSRGGSFETYIQAPNKSLTVIQAYPLGTIKVGFNGRNGWYQGAAGVRPVKNPAELGLLQRDSDIYSPLRLKSNYAKVSVRGMSQIGYRDVYVLDLQPAVGSVERVYLDAKTYLPVRINTSRKIGNVMEPVEIYLDDWREVDGIMFPFSYSQRSAKLTLSFTVTEIGHNVPLDARLFEAPVSGGKR